MYQHHPLNLNCTDESVLQINIHAFIESYRKDIKIILGTVDNPLFIPNAPLFLYINKTESSKKSGGKSGGSSKEVEEWFDYKKMYESDNILQYPGYELKKESSLSPSSGQLKSNMRHASTLDRLLNAVDSSLEMLGWSEVSGLIIGMGGHIENIGGSIKMLFVPGEFSFPVRFDRSSPHDKLGIEKASFLRRIFERWGISSSSE